MLRGGGRRGAPRREEVIREGSISRDLSLGREWSSAARELVARVASSLTLLRRKSREKEPPSINSEREKGGQEEFSLL